jgi:hypothetical protein
VQTGLYEQLLTLALQQELEGLADPRLYTVAPVDAEDAHAAISSLGAHARRCDGDVSWFGSEGPAEAPDRSGGCRADGGVGAGLGPSTQHLDTTPAAARNPRGAAKLDDGSSRYTVVSLRRCSRVRDSTPAWRANCVRRLPPRIASISSVHSSAGAGCGYCWTTCDNSRSRKARRFAAAYHHYELHGSDGSAGHRRTEQAAEYRDSSQLRYQAYATARQGISVSSQYGIR